MKRLVILGCGGYGRTVADVAEQLLYNVIFLDDNSSEATGKCEEYSQYLDCEIYPAFGNNEIRIKWIKKLTEEGYNVPTIIHPSAYVSPTVKIGVGCVVLPHAIINTDVVLGGGCIINIGAIVDHGCILGDAVHVAPGAIIKGENKIDSFMKIDSDEVVPLRKFPLL